MPCCKFKSGVKMSHELEQKPNKLEVLRFGGTVVYSRWRRGWDFFNQEIWRLQTPLKSSVWAQRRKWRWERWVDGRFEQRLLDDNDPLQGERGGVERNTSKIKTWARAVVLMKDRRERITLASREETVVTETEWIERICLELLPNTQEVLPSCPQTK